jgi:hypothetical protein
VKRIIGYHLSTDGVLDAETLLYTQKRAMDTAMEKLSTWRKNHEKRRVIGVVRAKDKVLLMTISLNKQGGLQVDKK